MDALRPQGDGNNSDSHGTFEEARNAPFLVIDDFGKAKRTEWADERMFSLINYRYTNVLPTVITTNTMPSNFQSEWGDALASRIRRMFRIRPDPNKGS